MLISSIKINKEKLLIINLLADTLCFVCTVASQGAGVVLNCGIGKRETIPAPLTEWLGGDETSFPSADYFTKAKS